MEKELTDFEKKVYEFIKESGEVQTTNIPPRMRGAVPSLKNKGLIQVYKKRTSPWRSKKKKFIKIVQKIDFATEGRP